MKLSTFNFILFTLFLSFNSFSQEPGSGYALDFDGSNDYVDIEFIPNSSSGTVEGWFKNTNEGMVWSMGKSSDNNVHTWVTISSSKIQIYCANGVGNGFHFITQSTINTEEWIHFAFVSDGLNQPKLYLNGINQALDNGGAFNDNFTIWWDDISTCNNHSLGVLRRNTAIAFGDITIDEIRIWNIALTETQIQENMCKKLEGNETGLVAYYRMDEGADGTCTGGEDVCDQTGNGNNGTKY